jgi:Bystin
MVPAGLDPKVVAVYHGVGQLLSRFTTGKIPKAFKVLTSCIDPCLLMQSVSVAGSCVRPGESAALLLCPVALHCMLQHLVATTGISL